jgi:hypothetical protein
MLSGFREVTTISFNNCVLHHVNQIDLFEDGGDMFVRNVRAYVADSMMS